MENNVQNRKPAEDFLTMADLWHLCLAHWHWFAASFIACLGFALYYLSVTPNIYTREAAILVKQESQKSSGKSGDGEVLSDVSVVQQQTNVPNVQRQLISLDVLSEVARRMKMAETEPQCLKVAQSLAGRLKTKVEDEESSVINLSITDTDPWTAEKILSTTIQAFNEKWLADKNQIAASTSAFIQERLVVLEKELGIVDDSISNFKARNRITDLGRVSDLYLQQQSTSEAQILTLNNQKAMALYILGILRDKESRHQLLPTNSGINNSIAESQITQYNTLLLQLKNSMYHTSSQNPLIIKQESDLSDIRKNIVETINNHIKALDIQLNSYTQASGEANSKIGQNPGQEKHLLGVEREQKVKESLYLYLLQKKEENEISTTYTSYITEIIDQPHGSDAPTSPNRRNILFAAILLALVVPTIILFVRENLDTTVRSKYDIEHKSNLMLIGEVPLCRYDSNKQKTVVAPRFKTTTLRDLLSFGKKKPKQLRFLVVQPDKQDIVNEAFRVLRTHLEFMTSKHGDKNVYIVTSSYEGSGKTFISTNLAVALTIKGKSVLFIDGDLRHASASHMFDCPKIGLADYLADQESDWQNILVSPEEYPSLDILPVGTIPPNPTELLATDRLGQLVAEARPLYDFIIIDCPPTETLADTGIIERQADRTLFVMRAGLFERKRIEDLDADAKNGKYKHMSLILNGVKYGGRYGYRYGYHYGYRYGYKYGYYSYGSNHGEGRGFFSNPWRVLLYIIICVLMFGAGYYGFQKYSEIKSKQTAPSQPVSVIQPDSLDTAFRDSLDTIIDDMEETLDATPDDIPSAAEPTSDEQPSAPAASVADAAPAVSQVSASQKTAVAQPAATPKTAAIAAPAATPKPAATAPRTTVAAAPAGKFTIVLNCFQAKATADQVSKSLQKEGLKDCFVYTDDQYARVVYSHYKTREEAFDQLYKLRPQNANFKEAWVLEMK